MAEFVIIHGGHNSGAVWKKVSALLERRGHTVFHPTLGDPEKTTLSGHISEVCMLIREKGLEHVILAGHSYAGMVITGVADRMPDRIGCLVYVDAVVPRREASPYGIFEDFGISYKDFGLNPDRPFIDPLFFDEEKIRKIRKIYVHCTQSEFLEVGGTVFAAVRASAERDNWTC